MIDRLKKTAVFGAALAVAGAFALAAAFCALYGLLATVTDGPWAAAITAGTFAAVFAIFAFTHKPPAKPAKHKRGDDDGHDSRLAQLTGIAGHLPAQLAAVAKRHPAAAIGLSALAAVVVLRRPTLALMAATHLFGMGRRKTRWERLRDSLPF